MPDSPSLRDRIQALRRDHGVSVNEIAKRSDALPADVSRFLRRTEPKRRPLEPRLADAVAGIEREVSARKSSVSNQ